MSSIPVTQSAQRGSPSRHLAHCVCTLMRSFYNGAVHRAEVLSGATRVSFIFAFVPEMMMWGCGALAVIRELVKRWDGGWTSVLAAGAGAGCVRGVRGAADISCAAAVAGGLRELWARVWRELGLLSLHAGL